MNIPFLYIWIHLPTKKWYIGSRTAKNCHPSEHKEKLSKAHSQRQRSPHSLETKLKMSDTRKGRIVSEETKKKISKTMQNKAQLKRCSLLTAMLQ